MNTMTTRDKILAEESKAEIEAIFQQALTAADREKWNAGNGATEHVKDLFDKYSVEDMNLEECGEYGVLLTFKHSGMCPACIACQLEAK